MKRTFKVRLGYRLASTDVLIQTVGEPFWKKSDAEKFIEEQKLLFEMTNSTLVTESIETSREIIVDYKTAKAYVNSLKLKTKDDYYNWWDKYKPSFIPRDPEKYYGKN